MDLQHLRAELVDQEQFSPDLDTVRERIRLGTKPVVSHAFPRRRLAIAASIAVVAVLAAGILLVQAHARATQIASPPSLVGGIRWELTSATVPGMPDYGSRLEDTESLYLYPDGTSVAIGFCFTREGRWYQSGTDLVFTDQHMLDHGCAIGMNSTAARMALLHLDGPMRFTTTPNALHLRNSTTTMTFTAAGTIPFHPDPVGPPTDPKVAALTGSAWQLVSADRAGKTVALRPDKPTTMILHPDGTSEMDGPACFYRTGRWHQVADGIELIDQVSPMMFCYEIADPREMAGGEIFTGLVGALTATISPTMLTLHNGNITAMFKSVGPPAGNPTPTDIPEASGLPSRDAAPSTG